MTGKEKAQQIEKTIKKVGLPSIDIQVYGDAITYIHITCDGAETANAWLSLLNQICTKTSINKTLIENKINKGTCLIASNRIGYRIHGDIVNKLA